MIKLNFPILFCIVSLVFLGNISLAQQSSFDTIPENRMRKDITILASDSLQGREAGTYGEKMASAYISNQMREIGLLPKGDADGSYLSEFRMNFPVIFKEASLKINDIEFKHIEEFGATDLSSEGNVTAQIINLPKGNSFTSGQPESGKGIRDIQGKIVILDIASKSKSTDNAQILTDIVARVETVIQQGAVAVILHNSSRKSTEDVLFGSPFTVSVNIPVVYIARLPYNKIRKLRNATCTLSVEINRTVSKPANVIGWIDNKATKTVVIGAHYDHLGIVRARSGGDKTPQIHNGADDNASGTAALLEIARWTVNNKSLKYNYIFVAFSAEEKGLFGSKAFCARPWVNNKNILYMLNLDMVGRLGCQGDTINVLGVASSDSWEMVLDKLDHPDFSIKRINGAPAFSDHSPFLKKDIPVIYFTTGLHPEYHTPKDDTGLINFTGMSELVHYIDHFIESAEALPGIPFHNVNTLQNTRAYLQVFK